MARRRNRFVLLAFLLFCSFHILQGQTPPETESVLIETPKPYDRVVAAIESRGGRVTNQFKYVDAVSAKIPIESLQAIRNLVGPANMYKDVDVPRPQSVQPTAGRDVKGQQV